MGPRPGGRGEPPRARTCTPRSSRFNGAAPRRARRESGTASPAFVTYLLQWGRAPEGAESLRRCVGGLRQGGFNGAAPRRARRARGPRGRSAPDRSFNGAAPRRARRAVPLRARRRIRQGFNGAAPRRARRAAEHGARGTRVDASMGPRPGGRGEVGRLVSGAAAWGFNGAAPRRARRVRTMEAAASSSPRLQWGRAPEGAESSNASSLKQMPGSLQWGRAPEGAERSKGWRHWVCQYTLQWGRAPEGAESGGGICTEAAVAGASMGPRPGGRGEKR